MTDSCFTIIEVCLYDLLIKYNINAILLKVKIWNININIQTMKYK